MTEVSQDKNEIIDSLKKNTRNKTLKYVFFDDIHDSDVTQRQKKKRKKDKKLRKNIKRIKINALKYDDIHFKTNTYGIYNTPRSKIVYDMDPAKKKIKFKKKLDPEEMKLIKRLNRTNKPTFNPKLYEESKIKRDELAEKLQKIEEKFGKYMHKLQEPKKIESYWDYVLKEMVMVSEYMSEKRKFSVFKSKKIANGARVVINNKQQNEVSKIKENEIRITRIAADLNRMIQKEFWKNAQKIYKFEYLQKEQQIHFETQQKKLEDFVAKQLELSSKMADYLKEKEKDIKDLIETNADNPSDNDNDNDHYNNNNNNNNDNDNDEEVFMSDESEEIPYSEEEAPKIKTQNGYSYENYTLEDPPVDVKSTMENIANMASEVQPKGFTLNTSEVKIKQPFLMKGLLREYQIIGLNWLAMLWQKNINGILADEMGLGKTIQTISLLAHLACDQGIWGPHLIVVPTSILVNWEIEFKRWCPALKVLTYFGTPKERKQKRMGWSRINSFHICITSYKLAIQDKKIFRRKQWYYMILDEAHNIKNFKSQRWQILLNFHSKRRLLLTGTPLQNDVSELWSLMHFLMPNIFHSHTDFNQWFFLPMQQAIQKNQPINMNIIQHLHSILRPFLLRRLKKDVEKQLPSKTEYVIKCPLSRRQRYLYDEFINKDETKSKIQNQDFLNLMNVLMQLRKVCNHPDLFEPRSVESALILPNIKYSIPTLCLLHYYFKNHDEVPLIGLNFLQMEILGHSKIKYWHRLKNRPNITTLFEGLTYNERSINRYEGHFSYKWKRLRIELLNANPIYGHDLIYLLSTIMSGSIKKENWLKKLKYVQNIEDRIASHKYMIDGFIIAHKTSICMPIKMIPSRYNHQYEMMRANIQELRQNLRPIIDTFYGLHIKQEMIFPDKKLFIYDCGKLNKMIQLLKELKDQKHKVLIFTQMTKMLDTFEGCLSLYHFTYVRLDGGTRPDMRQRLVERFNNDPKIFCFISSTRSGGIGLNLTGADTVIFYDTDWNPAMDKQAQDRCHRIGQTRNVTIYRLISEYTIEENILLKNLQKRKLDEYIMEEGHFTTEFFESVNLRDFLGDMFGVSKLKNEEISYKQFEKTLERIEDDDDALAAKIAQKENEELIYEDNLKSDHIISKTFDTNENEIIINRDMLPYLYQYAMKYLDYLHSGGNNVDNLAIEDNQDVIGNHNKHDVKEKKINGEIMNNHHKDKQLKQQQDGMSIEDNYENNEDNDANDDDNDDDDEQSDGYSDTPHEIEEDDEEDPEYDIEEEKEVEYYPPVKIVSFRTY